MKIFMVLTSVCFLTRSAPHIPEVQLPEKCVLEVASAFRAEINLALSVLRDIASGRDLKKFLGVSNFRLFLFSVRLEYVALTSIS